MSLLMGIPVGDVLVTASKVAGSRVSAHQNTLVFIIVVTLGLSLTVQSHSVVDYSLSFTSLIFPRGFSSAYQR